MNGDNDLSHLPKEVADSWRQCRNKDINPYQITSLAPKSEINKILNENKTLISVVAPFIKMITDITKETNFIFVLCDNQGNLLDVRGNEEVLELARKSNFEIGANRSESTGTNAISLVLTTGKPWQLVGPEHYNVYQHQWTCSSAPIHDSKGKLVGVLNLSGHYTLQHTHTLGMVVSLAKAIEKELLFRGRFFNKKPQNVFTFEDIIGSKSSIMKPIINMAKIVSKADTRIIIEGESGTGKELFVQAIHSSSNRSDGPFIAVNCGAIPEQLIESELFGYEDGTFTGAKKGGKPGKFELATGGTLFLDEINSMPKDMQVKLLRVLQQNEVIRLGGTTPIPIDVRVIGASNESLETLVEEERFRQDLYFRLGIITIEIPPLRNRIDDIPEIFKFLFKKISNRLDLAIPDFDHNLIEHLQSYNWPGNIRELENYIERAIVLSQGQKLTIEHFPKKVKGTVIEQNEKETIVPTLENLEKESIKKALEEFEGNISRASKMLGITRKTLYKKIKDYQLQYENAGYVVSGNK